MLWGQERLINRAAEKATTLSHAMPDLTEADDHVGDSGGRYWQFTENTDTQPVEHNCRVPPLLREWPTVLGGASHGQDKLCVPKTIQYSVPAARSNSRRLSRSNNPPIARSHIAIANVTNTINSFAAAANRCSETDLLTDLSLDEQDAELEKQKAAIGTITLRHRSRKSKSKGRSASTTTVKSGELKDPKVAMEKENVIPEHHRESDSNEDASSVQSVKSGEKQKNSPSSTMAIDGFEIDTAVEEQRGNAEDSETDEPATRAPAFSGDNESEDVVADDEDTGSMDTVRVIETNNNIDTTTPPLEAEGTPKPRSNSQVTLQTYKLPSVLREGSARKAIDDSDSDSEMYNPPCPCDQIRKDPKMKTKVCIIM
uniref:Uncharacterized protein n=1 Tax=Panagrellus redivivus TaxID=6233 RepID=A0A7E4ZY84_PANRE